MDPAALLRTARERAELTQHEVARRAGTDPSVLSAYERGRRVPSLRTLERLLAASGLQMHVDLEPLHGDLDRRIDRLAALAPAQRLGEAARWGPWVPEALTALVAAGVPFAVAGPAAALLLGVPVPVEQVDLEVREGLEAARALVDGWRACRGLLLRPITATAEVGVAALYLAPEVVVETGETTWERGPGERYVARPVPDDPRTRALFVTVDGTPVPVLPPGARTGDAVLERAVERWRGRLRPSPARPRASAEPPDA